MIIFTNNPLSSLLMDNIQAKKILLVINKPEKSGFFSKYARSEGITVESWSKYLKKPNTDNELAVVFSFSYVIPSKIIKLFNGKLLNIHPSILPKFRGPSPLQSSILTGGKIGYSIIKVNEKIDCGEIVIQKNISNKNNTYEKLLKKILLSAAKEINKLNKITKIKSTKQDNSKATYCQKIRSSDLKITDSDNPESAMRKILCYFPKEKAYFLIQDKKFIIWQAKKSSKKLIVEKIQPEGKKPMSTQDFRNGYPKLLTKFPDFVRIH
ncbi:hypothetical protein COT77_00260 [Candidatus Berkelbacteria bacterium CG10_big_fil_rev_8_21_14_0_10_41_12]|uniref:Formyl transferase N-terminal domain-containing protein n=1 Tax=Candidatus Berkelbacteria bacterium CG10_big_fil_rev_8_21_14_0_10_41_12 TaxID=1974513 RepID=A0A2M6WXY5_9BACT|nr:MAG: hypothetical protein COT77_00260 [Candidatus Berkelbacteria bacterium CG10_big_fil_rev_8_21_14_0_10_41_12]